MYTAVFFYSSTFQILLSCYNINSINLQNILPNTWKLVVTKAIKGYEFIDFWDLKNVIPSPLLAFWVRYDYTENVMEKRDDKIPDPKEIEKEISEFLAKRFKDNVKIVSPVVIPQELSLDKPEKPSIKKKKINRKIHFFMIII